MVDEMYRKAGKMDADSFLTRFDVYRTDLAGVVNTEPLAGKRECQTIRAELYKLNVYGEWASMDHPSIALIIGVAKRRNIFQATPRHSPVIRHVWIPCRCAACTA